MRQHLHTVQGGTPALVHDLPADHHIPCVVTQPQIVVRGVQEIQGEGGGREEEMGGNTSSLAFRATPGTVKFAEQSEHKKVLIIAPRPLTSDFITVEEETKPHITRQKAELVGNNSRDPVRCHRRSTTGLGEHLRLFHGLIDGLKPLLPRTVTYFHQVGLNSVDGTGRNGRMHRKFLHASVHLCGILGCLGCLYSSTLDKSEHITIV